MSDGYIKGVAPGYAGTDDTRTDASEIARLNAANAQLEQIRARLLDELDTTWARLRACAVRLQEMEPLARELCDKLDAIITHPSYLGVFQVARIHGIHYTGAECQDELRALKEMLNTGDGTVNGRVEPEDPVKRPAHPNDARGLFNRKPEDEE